MDKNALNVKKKSVLGNEVTVERCIDEVLGFQRIF